MSVWGVAMAKDEEDVAYEVIAHLVQEGLQGIIVADNNSSDGTRDALERACKDFAGECEIHVIDDPDPGYYQSEKMSNLAAQAGDRGATWIVPFDMDEIWYSNNDHLATDLEAIPNGIWLVDVGIINHFGTMLDPVEDNPFKRIIYRQAEPQKLPKVACRWADGLVIEQGNHGAHYLNKILPGRIGGPRFQLRHFPYRSLEHFIKKAYNGAEAYKATNLPNHIGQHWREYGALLDTYGEKALQEVYEEWFFFKVPSLSGLVQDPAPWCRWS